MNTRQTALEWWSNLTPRQKVSVMENNGIDTSSGTIHISSKEIEAIWKAETQSSSMRLHKGEVVDESYPIEFQEIAREKGFKEENKQLKELLNEFIDYTDNDENQTLIRLREKYNALN